MSNTITNDRFTKNDYLKLSNGATDVIIDVLVLAGSSLAQTQWQKELVIFLSLNDQEIKGQGCVGFDISNLGWEMDHFEDQKQFLLKIIDSALKKTNWEILNYEPVEENIFSNLRRFKEMIIKYSKKLVEQRDFLIWNKEFSKIEFKKCVKHKVYKHPFGCKLCHTEQL